MPAFRFRAYGPQGNFSEGSLEALSAEAARDALWRRGLTPFEMREEQGTTTRWWQREVFTGRSATAASLAFLTRELATLRAADVAVDEALRILSEQAQSGASKALVDGLLADVLNGAALSDAMQRRPLLFPAEYVSAVRAGESAGTSAEVLQDLARLLERRLELRARVQSALVYPAVLLAMAVLSIGMIISVLIPTLAPIFAESGKPMPASLRVLVGLQSYWPQLVLGLAFGLFAARTFVRRLLRRSVARYALDRVKLRVPAVGPFLLQRDAASFARGLGTLLKAGVPLLPALASARDNVVNAHTKLGLERACALVSEGRSLHDALRAEANLPSLALRLVTVGEEAGKLDVMLVRVADILEQQIQRSLDRAMTLLTPVITLCLALPVAGLILSVMNALLSVNELVAP